MTIQTFIVDSFTSEQFRGNPTSVCILTSEIETSTMLSIARQLNYPVTAFLFQMADANHYKIRYFTPTTEIPACGHATLASSFSASQGRSAPELWFHTVEGISIRVAENDGLLTMSYPKYNTSDFEVSENLLHSLGLTGFLSAGLCSELETLFLELESPRTLRNVRPDFNAMVKANKEIIEVVITSPSDDPRYDFLLRSFCPWIGINEDPVTGSVFSVLGGMWQNNTGKAKMKAWQASERGGEIVVNTFEDKVEIGGNCLMFLVGEVHI